VHLLQQSKSRRCMNKTYKKINVPPLVLIADELVQHTTRKSC
jgi:hypothetical protein